ncbi:hypothetical protein [Asticcacaulis sp.]|uniref:hypothetical protein n=1 Tax=Asticcacaulis sp. TaxID=1872648 RepID=UPI00262DC2C3|nr:hypothetical protein [Asticcacaulis sp.]
MARIEINWVTTDHISIFEEARELGFDLRKFKYQNKNVQNAMKKSTVDSIIKKIRDRWVDENIEFKDIKNGVYIISICDGFCVKYTNFPSEIMYIGRGSISNRIRSHLANWIFEMSLSLRDAPFKFYMTRVGDSRSPNAFKDFEHYLLETFNSKFGEKPLINKIGGRLGKVDHTYSGEYIKPLDNRGKNYFWEIRPTERNKWFKRVEDE